MTKSKVSKQLQSQEKNAVQRSKNTPVRNKTGKIGRLKWSLFIAIGLLFLLFIGFVLGINQWGVKYVECGGAPVIATSNLAAANSRGIYIDDKDYAPNFFDSYRCMTPEEKAGKRY